jgi:hypothetical protein
MSMEADGMLRAEFRLPSGGTMVPAGLRYPVNGTVEHANSVDALLVGMGSAIGCEPDGERSCTSSPKCSRARRRRVSPPPLSRELSSAGASALSRERSTPAESAPSVRGARADRGASGQGGT